MNRPNQKEFLKWKRKNVSLRGMKEVGKSNGVYGSFGRGLYSAFLSNKALAKQYDKVYFVVGGIPSNPKIVQNVSQAETFIWEILDNWCTDHNVNPRWCNFKTTIEEEMRAMGYDGLIISGREYVNYSPKNIKYFSNEDELYSYYMSEVHQ